MHSAPFAPPVRQMRAAVIVFVVVIAAAVDTTWPLSDSDELPIVVPVVHFVSVLAMPAPPTPPPARLPGTFFSWVQSTGLFASFRLPTDLSWFSYATRLLLIVFSAAMARVISAVRPLPS